MSKLLEEIIIIIVSLIIGCIVTFVIAWPFMLLWNWLMPTIFGLCKIGFWQSIGLLILSNIIFKNTSYSSSK